MIPNAWFYKLKDMSSNRSKHNSSQSQSTSKKKLKPTTISPQKPQVSQPFYFTDFNPDSTKLHGFHNPPFIQNFSDTRFLEPARKSSKRRSRRKTIYKPSPRVVNPVSAACTCRVSPSSVGTLPHSPNSSFSCIEYSPRTEAYDSLSEAEGANTFSSDSFDDLTSLSSSCKCTLRSSNNDIIIDMNDELVGRKTDKLHGFDWIRELDQLPLISRKTMRLKQKATEGTKLRSSSKWTKIKANKSLSVKTVEENIKNVEKQKTSYVFRKPSASPISVKLRANSPRIGRRIQSHARRNVPSGIRLKSKNSCLLESVAMVKTSHNPREDFRESMLEMIIENNIRSSKDLEDLLACYLILNSDEYHDLIIKTFEHIWFDMAEFRI